MMSAVFTTMTILGLVIMIVALAGLCLILSDEQRARRHSNTERRDRN